MSRLDFITDLTGGSMGRRSALSIQRPVLDRAHPYAPGPSGIFMPFLPSSRLINLCDGRQPASLVNSAQISLSHRGLQFNGATGASTNNPAIVTYSPITTRGSCFIRYRSLGVQASFGHIISDAVTVNNFRLFRVDADNDIDMTVMGTGVEFGNSVTIADLAWHDLWLVWDTTSPVVSGVYDNRNNRSGATTTTDYSSNSNIRIGSRQSDNRYALNGEYELLAVWPNRVFSQAECYWVQQHLYDLVKPAAVSVSMLSALMPSRVSGATLISIADTGTGTDSVGVSVLAAIAEVAAGTDAVSIAAALSITDVGAGADAAPAIAVAIQVTDIGLGDDATTIYVALSITDTGSAADALSTTSEILKSISDLASGTDEVSVYVQVSLEELGSGADAISNLAALVSLIEEANGTDVVVATNDASRIAWITFTLAQRVMSFVLSQRAMTFSLAQRDIQFSLN